MQEKVSRLFEQKLVWNYPFFLFVLIFVLILYRFQNVLDSAVLTHHLVGGDGAHASNGVGVVAAAQDAEVYELSLSHLETLEDLC